MNEANSSKKISPHGVKSKFSSFELAWNMLRTRRTLSLLLTVLAAYLLVQVVNLTSGSIPAGSAGGEASGSCASQLAGWAAGTGATDLNGGEDLQFVSTFGESSPIAQWIQDEFGIYMSNAIQLGQSQANQLALSAANKECARLDRQGIDTSNIPSYP